MWKKKSIWKGCVLYNPKSLTFFGRQNYGEMKTDQWMSEVRGKRDK